MLTFLDILVIGHRQQGRSHVTLQLQRLVISSSHVSILQLVASSDVRNDHTWIEGSETTNNKLPHVSSQNNDLDLANSGDETDTHSNSALICLDEEWLQRLAGRGYQSLPMPTNSAIHFHRALRRHAGGSNTDGQNDDNTDPSTSSSSTRAMPYWI